MIIFNDNHEYGKLEHLNNCLEIYMVQYYCN